MTIMESLIQENDSDNSETFDPNRDENTEGQNLGWADSIAKVLKTNKPKGKKTLILSKAKKISDLKHKIKVVEKEAGFEIENEVKEEKPEVQVENEAPSKKKRKKDIVTVRVKPNILDKDRERTLSKIATRGVVQLFNAVRMQQKDLAVKLQKSGPLERKREQILQNIDKKSFLNVLMGTSKSEEVDNPVKDDKIEKEDKDPTWDVLKDDFMMGAKLKDWDRNDEEESDIDETVPDDLSDDDSN